MTQPQEIEPFILFRRSQESAEVALWKLADGCQAIALFLDRESADAYRKAAKLDDGWQTMQPEREALVAVLKEAESSGIEQVVLQPTSESASRLWSIREVLENTGS